MSARARPPLRIGWTIYAALLTVFVLVGEIRNVILGAGIDFVTIADWVLSLVMLTATWGYALQRRFGAVAYWKSAFWIELFATAVMLIPVLLGTLEALVYTAVLLLLVVPAYVASYCYAYRSAPLWTDAAAG
jgi:hypothetical protein